MKFSILVASPLVAALGCASPQPLSETGQQASLGVIAGRPHGTTARAAVMNAYIGGTAGAAIGKHMDALANRLKTGLSRADVNRLGEGVIVVFENAVLFGSGADAAQLNSYHLSKIADAVASYPGAEMLIVSHVHTSSAATADLDASARRAAAVRDYFVQHRDLRVPVRAVGRGEEEPMSTGSYNSPGYTSNRVEIAIYAGPDWRQ